MTLRKLIYLFMTTSGIGLVSGLLLAIGLERELWKLDATNIAIGLVGHLGAGLLFSMIAQMGFVCYLTLNRFGLGLFRSKRLWHWVQLLLIVFVVYDVIALRYEMFGGEKAIWSFVWMPLTLLVISIAVAVRKMQLTNRSAFVPTLFFMFVVTVIEWIPALRTDNTKTLLFMVIPLAMCNAWQILQLHKLSVDQVSDQQNVQAIPAQEVKSKTKKPSTKRA